MSKAGVSQDAGKSHFAKYLFARQTDILFLQADGGKRESEVSMANFFENMDMGFVWDFDEDDFRALMALICSDGNPITGYYGLPYINYHFNSAQVILQTQLNDTGSLEIAQIDTHVSGSCVWKLRISGFDIEPDDALKTSKQCVLSSIEDNSGMLVVNIVNADVLPSYMEGDEITVQMVAYAENVDYFASEEEYRESCSKDDKGTTGGLASGAVFPMGILVNHRVKEGEEEIACAEDDVFTPQYSDSLMLVKGEVKAFRKGHIFKDEQGPGFVRCIIDTHFGELEIVHSIRDVNKSQLENLRTGAIVSAVVYLSGDVAIYEYENGIVRDEEHNLRALRYSMTGGDASRLASILAPDVVYTSEVTGRTFKGREAVIDRIDFVNKYAEEEYFSHMATITSVQSPEDEGHPDPEAGGSSDDARHDPPDYDAGKRCAILCFGDKSRFESILFIECNEDGLITRILTSNDSRYRFRLDDAGAV